MKMQVISDSRYAAALYELFSTDTLVLHHHNGMPDAYWSTNCRYAGMQYSPADG